MSPCLTGRGNVEFVREAVRSGLRGKPCLFPDRSLFPTGGSGWYTGAKILHIFSGSSAIGDYNLRLLMKQIAVLQMRLGYLERGATKGLGVPPIMAEIEGLAATQPSVEQETNK